MAKIKVRISLEQNNAVVVEMETSTKVTPHLQLWELANTSAKDDVKYIITARSYKFLKMVEMFRAMNNNQPLQVNSNYRTPSFNNSVPNADPKSCHLDALAIDLAMKKLTAEQRTKLTNNWKNICAVFGEIGAINQYTNGIHLEIATDEHYGAKSFVTRDYRGRAGDW